MPNSYFQFKQFLINQDQCGMKVTTDACLFGALIADKLADNSGFFLDIGTGTGLLSLMLAQKTEATIEAIEIDHEAYIQAQANFSHSPWQNRLKLNHTSFQVFYSDKASQARSYDHIICNPPFFSEHMIGSNLSKNKALHNEDNLLHALSINIASLLKPQGQFHLLLPAYEMNQFVQASEQHGLYPQTEIDFHHKSEKPVFRKVVSFGKNKIDEVAQSTILIHGEGRQYTEEFTSLLAPYYLHL